MPGEEFQPRIARMDTDKCSSYPRKSALSAVIILFDCGPLAFRIASLHSIDSMGWPILKNAMPKHKNAASIFRFARSSRAFGRPIGAFGRLVCVWQASAARVGVQPPQRQLFPCRPCSPWLELSYSRLLCYLRLLLFKILSCPLRLIPGTRCRS